MSETKKKFLKQLSLIGLGKEKNFFLENFANLLNSGMPLLEAMTLVADEIKNPTLKKIILKMTEDIGAGYSLAQTMEESELFSAHVIALIRIGQSSGRLNENIKIIVTEQKKSQEMNGKIRSALMYPGFVLVLVLVVGIGIAWFILPKLATVFNGLSLEIPIITRYLINFGLFLQSYGVIAVPIFFIFLGAVVYFVFFYEKTRNIGEVFLFHCPGISRLMRESEIAKFGFLLGTLLSAGLSPLESMESLVRSTRTKRFRGLYEYILANLSDGFSFRQSFKTYPTSKKLIPSSIQQVIVSGEQSGMFADALLNLGANYESRIEQTTKDLSIMLEPIMLIIVWVGVVGLALSVILPVYDLIGGLG